VRGQLQAQSQLQQKQKPPSLGELVGLVSGQQARQHTAAATAAAAAAVDLPLLSRASQAVRGVSPDLWDDGFGIDYIDRVGLGRDTDGGETVRLQGEKRHGPGQRPKSAGAYFNRRATGGIGGGRGGGGEVFELGKKNPNTKPSAPASYPIHFPLSAPPVYATASATASASAPPAASASASTSTAAPTATFAVGGGRPRILRPASASHSTSASASAGIAAGCSPVCRSRSPPPATTA